MRHYLFIFSIALGFMACTKTNNTPQKTEEDLRLDTFNAQKEVYTKDTVSRFILHEMDWRSTSSNGEPGHHAKTSIADSAVFGSENSDVFNAYKMFIYFRSASHRNGNHGGDYCLNLTLDPNIGKDSIEVMLFWMPSNSCSAMRSHTTQSSIGRYCITKNDNGLISGYFYSYRGLGGVSRVGAFNNVPIIDIP